MDQGGTRPTFGYLLKFYFEQLFNDYYCWDMYIFEDAIFPQFGGHKGYFIYLL